MSDCQAHGLIPENPFVHQFQIICNQRLESHLLQNIFFQVDTGSNFRQHEALLRKAENSALSDIKDVLAVHSSKISTESDLLDIPDEFFDPAFFLDVQFGVADFNICSA